MTKLDKYLLILTFFSATVVSAQTGAPFVRPNIERIVQNLKKDPIMHLGLPVGFAGVPETDNKYYRLYHKLSQTAMVYELVGLTNDSSKLIVLYAFSVLAARDYPGLKDIFDRHLNDTTIVWLASGCTGSCDRVNRFMLNNLNPKYPRTCKPYLTKEEFDKYCIDIGQRYPFN